MISLHRRRFLFGAVPALVVGWREHAFSAWGLIGICSMYGVALFWPHPPRVAQIASVAVAMSWYAAQRWRERA